MVIVKLQNCLEQLSETTQYKIIEQLEVETHVNNNHLMKLLSDEHQRKTFIKKLNKTERQYISVFLQKYSPFLFENDKQHEANVTSDERIASLSLRQKGLKFKLMNHNQPFIIPLEIARTFVHLRLKKLIGQKAEDIGQTKPYLCFIFRILETTIERKIKKIVQLEDVIHERTQKDKLSISMIISFLVEEGILVIKKDIVTISQQAVHRLFDDPAITIEEKLTFFIGYKLLNDRLLSLYISCLINKRSSEKFLLTDMIKLLKYENSSLSITSLYELIKQLQLLGLAVSDEQYIQSFQTVVDENIEGIQVSPFEILIPVFSPNQDLWMFHKWGEIIQWDLMVHIKFSKKTFARALNGEETSGDLIRCLKRYFQDDVVGQWNVVFKEWEKEVKPIEKKQGLTFYPITEVIHQELIQKQWSSWIIRTVEGIIIESSIEKEFDALLKTLAIQVRENKGVLKNRDLNDNILIVDEFPNITEVFPGLNKVPKQWFSLTKYEEHTKQRIVKQAIILQLSLHVELHNKEVKKVFPVKLEVCNGNYKLILVNHKQLSLEKINRIAIANPAFEEQKEVT